MIAFLEVECVQLDVNSGRTHARFEQTTSVVPEGSPSLGVNGLVLVYPTGKCPFLPGRTYDLTVRER